MESHKASNNFCENRPAWKEQTDAADKRSAQAVDAPMTCSRRVVVSCLLEPRAKLALPKASVCGLIRISCIGVIAVPLVALCTLQKRPRCWADTNVPPAKTASLRESA
eukprot:scaffold304877_cov29-Prasinocladus_malaysianus.AAC.1